MHKTLLPPETEASRIANAQKIVLEVGIPSQPRALMDIRRLAANPDVDFEQICDIVRNDPMLSSNTLRLAASPLFGGTQVFESISQSLMVLGFQHFKRCVLSAIVEKTLSSNGYSMERFWVHSTAVAALCQRICERFVPEMADSAYQAGLLHDVGTLVLNKYSEQYHRTADQALALDFRNLVEEYAEYGTDHGAISMLFCQKWEMPQPVCEVIAYHHEPDYSCHAAESTRVLKAILQLAEMLFVYGMNQGILGLAPNRKTAEVLASIRGILGIDDEELDSVKSVAARIMAEPTP
ncbi:MAG: HDOD domain-containing protein [Opitutales bacterium]|nr:HDOD domain-containing protein [Opitutales bacterium]